MKNNIYLSLYNVQKFSWDILKYFLAGKLYIIWWSCEPKRLSSKWLQSYVMSSRCCVLLISLYLTLIYAFLFSFAYTNWFNTRGKLNSSIIAYKTESKFYIQKKQSSTYFLFPLQHSNVHPAEHLITLCFK